MKSDIFRMWNNSFTLTPMTIAWTDLLGDCEVHPSMYYKMTRSILSVFPVCPFVVALEGGYNTDVIACCMESVALAVLGESWDEDGLGDHDRIPQDRPIVPIESDSAARLKNGRNVLTSEWNHYASNVHGRGNIKNSAVQDINKSMRFIRETRFWKDRVDLQEIRLQVSNDKRVTRSSKSQETGNLDSIESALQSLKL